MKIGLRQAQPPFTGKSDARTTCSRSVAAKQRCRMKPWTDYLTGPSPPSGEAAAAVAQAAQRTAVAAAYFCRRVRSAGASSAGGSSSSPAASLHRKLQQAGHRLGAFRRLEAAA